MLERTTERTNILSVDQMQERVKVQNHLKKMKYNQLEHCEDRNERTLKIQKEDFGIFYTDRDIRNRKFVLALIRSEMNERKDRLDEIIEILGVV